MSEKYLMAIDGGTSSVRAIIFNTRGQQLYTAQHEWHHLIDEAIPGSMGFDYLKNWPLIKQCIKELLDNNPINPEAIVGIATTTMREGFIVYDDQKNELIGFANVDGRAVKESAQLKKDSPQLEQDMYKYTGESFALGALPRFLWIKNHRPDIFAKAKYFNMLNDWISFKLTGILASEPSNASTTGLFNTKTRQWDFTVLDDYAIHLSEIPVIESGQILGPITPEVAQETGLSTTTMVIMGGGDAQLGCIGIGALQENETALLGGSFWQLNHNTATFIPDDHYKARINCHALPNLWQYELIAWMPGVAMDWFTRAFFTQERKTMSKGDFYTYLNDHARLVPAGSYEMLALFANQMNMLELKNASPTFTNFQLDANKYHRFTFYRSLMESIAIVVKKHKDYIEEKVGHTIEEITFAGGAANNDLWCQILADVLSVPIKVPKIKEATAFGAAILAGIGAKVYNSLKDIQPLIDTDKVYTPNPDNHAIYRRLETLWSQVYDGQLSLVNQKLTTSMWKAPGL